MNNKPAASIAEGPLGPNGLAGTTLWIEESEDLTIRKAGHDVAAELNDSARSSREAIVRNLCIEETEDLTVHKVADDLATQVDEGALSSPGAAVRNLWIEEDEDLST